mgnify:CR=1 FL=1|tara:strand:+ start:707 stop:982 length:276 start_codon:yes stop_codon:yes gene_type:complete
MRILLMSALLALVLFTLCACSSVPPRIETVYVKVPVPVKCVKEIPRAPVFEVDRLTGNEPLELITDTYMVDRHQRKIYIGQLQAVMVGCVK